MKNINNKMELIIHKEKKVQTNISEFNKSIAAPKAIRETPDSTKKIHLNRFSFEVFIYNLNIF
jgi:hypothetical protein